MKRGLQKYEQVNIISWPDFRMSLIAPGHGFIYIDILCLMTRTRMLNLDNFQYPEFYRGLKPKTSQFRSV
jgi:hypothetical protein